MNVTTLEQWDAWSEKGADASGRLYTRLPYVAAFPLEAALPASWERAWEAAGPESFVLESGRTGSYTYLGLQARSVIVGRGPEATVTSESGSPYTVYGTPLELVKMWLRPWHAPSVPDAPPFLGGCVGFWGYDVTRSLEKLPANAAQNDMLPDYAFMLVDELWIVDHRKQKLYIAILKKLRPGISVRTLYLEAEHRAQRMYAQWRDIAAAGGDPAVQERRRRCEQAIKSGLHDIDPELAGGIERSFTKEEFMRAVRRIQAYIAAGDVFQVNLSTRQTRRLHAAPEAIYETLRLVNPSPYMGLLRLGSLKLVSCSPELLVQLHGSKLRTRPIAGTRPRAADGDAEADAKLSEELLLSEKERAEHIMLVDLERNDLGRISRYGTVKVDELMTIERYSHVMHIVSEVTGELAPGKDAFDVIAATFPGGTITGAPKVRTMEIIEELEPVRRGPYTGSMGWIDSGGNMEFNL